MSLKDAIKKKGYPFMVPNCSRDDLPELFADLGFKTGAEIGVDRGEYLEKFLDVDLKMYAVDTWANKKQAFSTVQKISEQNDNCIIVHKSSMEAIEDFPPRSLDFVYIDADHRFPFVAQDLYYWYWRVKKGGAIAGHDYKDMRPGQEKRSIEVQSIVDAFLKSFHIKNYYVFGPPKDEILSYMFFKNW